MFIACTSVEFVVSVKNKNTIESAITTKPENFPVLRLPKRETKQS